MIYMAKISLSKITVLGIEAELRKEKNKALQYEVI